MSMEKLKDTPLKAVVVCKKYVPSIKEETKDGVQENRLLVLKGDFFIFMSGQSQPIKLPVKLEFKDAPPIVQMVQEILNVQTTGEKCLLVLHSNLQVNLEEFMKNLGEKTKQQKLKFEKKKKTKEEE